MQINSRNLTNILLLFISLAAWWFTAFVINPELQYFLQQTAFLTDRLFFQGYASYPGGIADYLAVFIGQFFHFKIFGSFLIILVAALQGLIAMNLVQRVTGKVNWNFSIFALILFGSVWVQCDYHYPFYASSRLLLASIFVWIFTVLIQNISGIRIYLGFVLALLLFYLAGGASLFVFTAAAILIHIRFLVKKTEWLVLPALILLSGLIPYVAYKYLFLVDLSLVYSITHSKSPYILYYIADYKLYALYALLPVYLLISVLSYKFRKYPEQAITHSVESKKEHVAVSKQVKKNSGKMDKKTVLQAEKKVRKPWNTEYISLAGQFIILLAGGILCLNFTQDKVDRTKIMVSFYGAERDWTNVIKTEQSLKDYDPFVNFEYNKALANTGKLAENLLNYPQLAGSRGLFLDGTVTSDVPFICSDQYYDLGFINESAHWTFEAQTIFPNSPRLMKRLVQIHLITGQYKIAEKFLNRLSENMLYQDWVNEYRKFIQDTSLVAKDPEFAWKRKCQPLGNFAASSYVDKLHKLMEANPANRIAWEYLLCSSLLDSDLGTFEKLLRENKSFPKNPLPRSWDEAMVLFSYIKQTTPGPEDVRFSPEKLKQFVSFIKAMKPFGNDWKSARQSLKNDFGTTYWYYIKCLSPKVTKAQIKQQRTDGK
jgi:hypothetical protein